LATGSSGDDSYLIVLGTAQDGGYPQAGCRGACCARAWDDPTRRRHVSCLGIVDRSSGQRWLVDATPDFREQRHLLDAVAPMPETPGLSGIFLTHGHVGHYIGLVHLGREAIGARGVPVWAMPRMMEFLQTGEPWHGLVEWGHIALRGLGADTAVRLNDHLALTPLVVPHRDEHTETVGFRIDGPERSVLYIPDIDDWDRWQRRLADEIAAVDVAFLDGTFYDGNELPGRDLATIPHPLVVETMARLAAVAVAERAKLRFIHLNHTNPLLQSDSPQRQAVADAGFGVAEQGERVQLQRRGGGPQIRIL
jgi:pyrroloquinoline quinone biosynthesis protein B